jgi:hypothetical protein
VWINQQSERATFIYFGQILFHFLTFSKSSARTIPKALNSAPWWLPLVSGARRERIFDLGESTLGKSKFQLRPRKWDTFFRFAHELRQSKYLVGNITSAAFIQAERGYERASGAHSAPSAHLQIKIFW